ncbi:unnamed protein product [Dicrocoelium dendriticum]|nr:unnamed protein product [Dicrocoelium dendriticum]
MASDILLFLGCGINTLEVGPFLDTYDPHKHPDESLRKHLAITFRHPGTQMKLSDSPHVASGVDSSSNNLVLTRANIERIRKKQERMIKNRYAASMSRLRKKEYVERLEIRHEQLKRENLNLWRQNEEWRIRCEQLETCIRDLQSQINGLEPHESLSQSSGTGQPSIACHSSLNPVPELHNAQTFTTSPVPVGRPRLCLSALGGTVDPDIKVASSTWLNESGNVLQNPRQSIDGKGLPGAAVPGSGKLLSVTANAGTFPKTHRLSLVNLAGVIGRHRPGYLQANRPKVVATTSLLSILCLFTFGLTFQPLNYKTVNDLHNAALLNAVPIRSVGQRALLSVQSTLPVNMVTGGASDAFQNLPNNSSCGHPCDPVSSDFTLAASDKETTTHTVSRTLQHWLRRQIFANTGPTLNASGDGEAPSSSGWRKDSHVVSDIQAHPISSPHEFSSTERVHVDSPVARRFHSPKLLSKTAYPGSRPKATFNSPARSAVQPFYSRFMWAMDDLLDAAGRRNDTIYLVLSRLDNVHLHAVDPVYEKLSTHITLIVPAYPARNATDPMEHIDRSNSNHIMLQIDCELRNVSWIHPPGRSGND